MDDMECDYSNVYCCVSESNKEHIENNCIQDYNVEFFINKNNEIDYCTYPECRSEDVILDKLYDLIKADLVEKVSEV